MSNDEKARLAALRSYRILDTDAEAAFDDLTLLASRICQTPIALITLIDEKRQWFKSRVGTTLRETSREIAFCDHAIRQREMFVIPDALADARFRDNPAVVLEPRIRFYTGAPLINPEGQALGTLCVLDKKPRTLNPDQLEALDVLRRQVMAQLELRRNLRELQVALAERDRAESETERLIADLREALEGVRRLAALIPATPACQLDMRIPADVTAVPKVVSGVMQLIRLKGIAAGHEVDVEIAIQEARLPQRSREDRPVRRCLRRRRRAHRRGARPGAGVRRRGGPEPARWRRLDEGERPRDLPHQRADGRGQVRGRRPVDPHAQEGPGGGSHTAGCRAVGHAPALSGVYRGRQRTSGRSRPPVTGQNTSGLSNRRSLGAYPSRIASL